MVGPEARLIHRIAEQSTAFLGTRTMARRRRKKVEEADLKRGGDEEGSGLRSKCWVECRPSDRQTATKSAFGRSVRPTEMRPASIGL